MNYVFFGNNVPLAERLRKALGTGVIECITLLQMKNTLLPAEEMDYCVFIEKTDPTLNIPAIMHLHKTFQNIYIVLIAPEMTREEKIAYLQAGTDCVISESTSKEDLVKLLSIAEKCKRMEKARKPQMKESDLAIFKLIKTVGPVTFHISPFSSCLYGKGSSTSFSHPWRSSASPLSLSSR